jgi:DNA-binding beta-propeller fold protein YncE
LTAKAASGLNAPMGITRDAAGDLYVANNGAANVIKVTTLGATSVYATGVTGATDLRFDAQGRLFVSAQGDAGIYLVPPGGGAAPAVADNQGDFGQAAQHPAPDIGHHGEGQEHVRGLMHQPPPQPGQGRGPHLLVPAQPDHGDAVPPG